jgi:hypothetical protein
MVQIRIALRLIISSAAQNDCLFRSKRWIIINTHINFHTIHSSLPPLIKIMDQDYKVIDDVIEMHVKYCDNNGWNTFEWLNWDI